MPQQFDSEAVAADIEEKLDSSIFGLAALKILIDNLKILIDDIEAKLDNPTFGLEEIKNEIASTETEVGNIEDKLDSPVFGLQTIKDEIIVIDGLVDDIIADIGVFPTANYATLAAYVEDIRTRLIAILADIVTIDGVVDGLAADIGVFPTANYATLAAYVEDIRTRLIAILADIATVDTVVDGLAADMGVFPTANYATLAAYVENIRTRLTTIDTEVGAIETKLDTPANFMADVSGIIADIGVFPTANYATLAAYVEDIRTRLLAIVADTGAIAWGDITAIIADIGVFPTANYATLAAYVEDIRTRLIAILAATATLITSVVPKATDEQDSFTWVTATHGTNEFDISSLFTTPLTGTTRRRYSLFLDLTQAEADGAAWTTCTLKVKVKIDGVNYRTVDKKEIAKTDVAAAEEPGINIDIPALAKDCQVTMQFDVALAGNATIYYAIVTEVLE